MSKMKRHLREMHRRPPPEMDITAFMNLMVALVPFLLVTAVFSKITILQLNLPAAGGADQADEKKITIEVIVRRDRIEIGDGAQIVTRIPNKTPDAAAAGEEQNEIPYDLQALSNILLEIKRTYPGKPDATVLLEPDLEYEVLVTVMDIVSTVDIPDETGKLQKYELFPQISVGDAPGGR